MAELEGQILLNRYFLRQHVGAGGMADVYLAWDGVRSAKMAVKVLRRDLVNNPRFFQMFTKEAGLLRKLEHPSIVRLYEFERQGDIAFLVMDWVEGTNLRQAIVDHRKPFDLEYTSLVLHPVCAALGYGHQNGIFHCDVKPANILLHTDGRVLLTDFGVARVAAEEAGGGTPPYMAPEQFSGQPITAQTDVYGLGVMLFEMLTGGTLPFRGDSPGTVGQTPRERIGWEHLYREPPSAQVLNPHIPNAVENVIMTALAKGPEQRYPSPMALREAFEHARTRDEGKGLRPTPTRSTVTIRPPTAHRRESPEPTTRREAHGPCLLGISWELAGQVVTIPSTGLTIGRGSVNQLRLQERSVSRAHAVILRTRQGIFLRDQESALGTILNGKRIGGPTRLNDGDRIQIGYEQVFEFRGR